MKSSLRSLAITVCLFGLAGCGEQETDRGAEPKFLAVSSKASLDVTNDVALSGFVSDYSLRPASGEIVVTNKLSGVTGSYSDRSLFKFFDGSVSFDIGGPSGQVYRLYKAAFGRRPDPKGLGFWIEAQQNGMTLVDIARQFIASAEFRSLYGDSVTPDAFIQLIYRNILQRDGEPDGVAWWVQQVNSGADRASVLFGFADSQENRDKVAPEVAGGIAWVPTKGVISDAVTKSPNADALGYEEQNASHRVGEFVTNTGVWGIKAADAYVERLAGKIDADTGVANIIIDWDITPSKSPGVVTFPNLTYGLHPGWATSSTSKLPVRISESGPQVVSADINTTCTPSTGKDCLYQTGLDIFLMSSDKVSNADVGTEIMVFTERTIGPADINGADTVMIGGVTYKAIHNGFPTSWNAIQYFASMDSRMNKVQLNVSDFIADALRRGWITPTQYLVSIELGTEVVSGNGFTVVRNFRIN
jgi:hypothetical protein